MRFAKTQATDRIDVATLVIFGASGDLTERKLAPALHRLFLSGDLSRATRVLGVGRTPLDASEFRDRLARGVEAAGRASGDPRDLEAWPQTAAQFEYATLDPTRPQDLASLGDRLATRNVLFYFATPPDLVPDILRALDASDLLASIAGWTRAVFEKPYGVDLETARDLDRLAHKLFSEQQVYRIDHYLGKETVRNVLAVRFANAVFEPLWRADHVDHVQISVLENLSVGRRGASYDRLGAVRDVLQNHLLQLLALVAMDPPDSLDAESLRDAKVRVLDAVRPLSLADTVLAQYDGYANESGVAPRTQTPTYVAARLRIDCPRWEGVPFFVRTGKAMAVKTTEITLQFRDVRHPLFPPGSGPNRLSLRLQPDEGLHLRVALKKPGFAMATRPASLRFDFGSARVDLPDAYERLLVDALNGDPSLFLRDDEIETSWRIVSELLGATPLPAIYARDSLGPQTAKELLGPHRDWLIACRCAGEADA
ncbi:MAG: glucose-6-phosphate dehydrogenase [Candidatus Bipolaricaulota bacterium]